MARKRLFENHAERQRAYRDRLAERLNGQNPAPTPKVRRSPSRPARVAALIAEVERLKQEYERWLESLPEPLQEGDQADRLRDTVEQLEAIGELLSDLDPPRGFGRD
jgi:hypothetical protein